MILSHEHRFIFIKTTKTAGTSIEIALSKYCGPRDIITVISPDDEVQRRELGHRSPQHHLAKLRHYGVKDLGKRLIRGTRPERFYNHMPATEVKQRVPAPVWAGYFKFCVERNPWDRTVSQYFWQNPTEPRISIDAFIETGRHLKLHRQGHGLYTIDGAVVVDQILRFEHLAEDLEGVRVRLGLPEPIVLPRAKSATRAKSTTRAEKVHYRDLLTPVLRDRIARDFATEIEAFGYTF